MLGSALFTRRQQPPGLGRVDFDCTSAAETLSFNAFRAWSAIRFLPRRRAGLKFYLTILQPLTKTRWGLAAIQYGVNEDFVFPDRVKNAEGKTLGQHSVVTFPNLAVYTRIQVQRFNIAIKVIEKVGSKSQLVAPCRSENPGLSHFPPGPIP